MNRRVDIHRFPSAADLAAEVAARTVAMLVEVQAEGRHASWVLTGGRLAPRILEGVRAQADSIDWERVDLWWGDERFLPAGDPDRNDTLADDYLIQHVPIPGHQVHRVQGPEAALTPEQSAADYEAHLRAYALRIGDLGLPRFDVVHLSMGPDGHVASLFPESPALSSQQSVVAVHGAPKAPPIRVTLGFSALNNASQAYLIASGAEKATAVRMLTTDGAGYLQIPAAGVHAVNGTLLLLDEDAAGRIDPAIDGR